MVITADVPNELFLNILCICALCMVSGTKLFERSQMKLAKLLAQFLI